MATVCSHLPSYICLNRGPTLNCEYITHHHQGEGIDSRKVTWKRNLNIVLLKSAHVRSVLCEHE